MDCLVTLIFISSGNDYFESQSNNKIKIILNSTEWNITLHLHDFDQSWMRYALGKGSDIIILDTHFSGYHIIYSYSLFEEIWIQNLFLWIIRFAMAAHINKMGIVICPN